MKRTHILGLSYNSSSCPLLSPTLGSLCDKITLGAAVAISKSNLFFLQDNGDRKMCVRGDRPQNNIIMSHTARDPSEYPATSKQQDQKN